MESRGRAALGRVVSRRLLLASAAQYTVLRAVRSEVPPKPATAASPSSGVTAGDAGLVSFFGSENRVIRTRERVVAVTFNAAWNDAGLDRILGELARRHAPATFFLTGDFADRYPRVVKRIAAGGHGLGNHSYSHPYFKDLTVPGRVWEVRAAERALRAAGAGRALTPFFRFPYSETSPAQVREVNALGFADIEFTTDTNGWKGTGGGMTVIRALRRALDALRPGAILQMHVGASGGGTDVIDAQALPRILDAVVSRGYRVIDLRTLLCPSSLTASPLRETSEVLALSLHAECIHTRHPPLRGESRRIRG